MSTTKRYIGLLTKASNHEEDDLLGIIKDGENVINILAELIRDDMDIFGKYLSVKYYISTKKTTFEDIQTDYLSIVIGNSSDDIRYDVFYSEITGYLWTDEAINIGGHNILQELCESLGKYLYLEITFFNTTEEQEKG